MNTVHTEYSLTIYATPEECCQKMFGWLNTDICVAMSNGAAHFSDQWYVDWVSMKCVKDCDPNDGMPCGGSPAISVTLYESAELCCKNKLFWIGTNNCVANSNGAAAQGSTKWYIDWVDGGKCVKDCVGNPPCGGLKEVWDQDYSSASACCSAIPWVPSDRCHL